MRHPAADFWPEDTKKESYLSQEASLEEILKHIQEKWPNAKPEDIMISAEHIHCFCVSYDLYDSSDYVDFVKLTNIDME